MKSRRKRGERLAVGVIGVGHLGQFHVEKYAQMEQVSLVGLYDVNRERLGEIASRFKTKVFDSLSDLLNESQAVSVVVPTTMHYEITAAALEAGCDVLLEKPMTDRSETAKGLLELSRQKKAILQIGHVERFNPTFCHASNFIKAPELIEIFRWSPWPKRNLDVDVVLDLMIHDIDLALTLHSEEIESVSAFGQLTSGAIDSASASILFRGGALVFLSASRLSHRSERLMRIHQAGEVLHLDLLGRHLMRGVPGLAPVEIPFPREGDRDRDALYQQLHDFVAASLSRTPPLVSAEDGVRALEVAERIQQALREGRHCDSKDKNRS